MPSSSLRTCLLLRLDFNVLLLLIVRVVSVHGAFTQQVSNLGLHLGMWEALRANDRPVPSGWSMMSSEARRFQAPALRSTPLPSGATDHGPSSYSIPNVLAQPGPPC
jgi:hypothetical protein